MWWDANPGSTAGAVCSQNVDMKHTGTGHSGVLLSPRTVGVTQRNPISKTKKKITIYSMLSIRKCIMMGTLDDTLSYHSRAEAGGLRHSRPAWSLSLFKRDGQ